MKGPRAVVFLFLTAALALLFGSSFIQNLSGPPLVIAPEQLGRREAPRDAVPEPGQTAPPSGQSTGQNAGQSAAQGMPQGMGKLSPEDGARMGEFMARLQANPHDANLLLEIAQVFMRAQEWPQADNFLRRAAVAAPTDARPLHFLGVSQAARQQYAEAAASFEQALALDPNPSTQYNLAILYRYYLNQPAKAKALLEAAAASPAAPESLKAKAKQELDGLKTP